MNGMVQVSIWMVIGQWTLLFALGVLVIVAYRQLGYLVYLKDMVSNAGSEKDGLAVGTLAPLFSYIPIRQGKPANSHQYFEPTGKGTLLLFADPGCVSCQNALTTLEELAPQIGHKISLTVMTSSDPTLIAVVKEFHSSTFELGLIRKEIIFTTYRTNTTPFLYLIDAKGVIQAKGIAGSKSDIKKVLRKIDRSFGHSPIEIAYPLN